MAEWRWRIRAKELQNYVYNFKEFEEEFEIDRAEPSRLDGGS